MNILTKIHTVLCCLFAPLLVVLMVAEFDDLYDIEQQYELSESAENILYNINKIRDESRLSTGITAYNNTQPFQIYAMVVIIGIMVSTLIGILAGMFTSGPRIQSILALILGIAAPVLILWYQ